MLSRISETGIPKMCCSCRRLRLPAPFEVGFLDCVFRNSSIVHAQLFINLRTLAYRIFAYPSELARFEHLAMQLQPCSANHYHSYSDLLGTFAPFLLASERPMATACFMLFTRLPPFPAFNLPFFNLCIARPTASWRPFHVLIVLSVALTTAPA